jgi:hypothetical protein
LLRSVIVASDEAVQLNVIADRIGLMCGEDGIERFDDLRLWRHALDQRRVRRPCELLGAEAIGHVDQRLTVKPSAKLIGDALDDVKRHGENDDIRIGHRLGVGVRRRGTDLRGNSSHFFGARRSDRDGVAGANTSRSQRPSHVPGPDEAIFMMPPWVLKPVVR